MEIKKWIILLTLLVIVNPTTAQTDGLERKLRDLMDQYDAIGVSVAVVKENQIVFTHSYGYKDIEDSIPLHVDDLFRIASVSKTFVATAIMQLVEKGRLSLDDDVNKYLKFKVQNPNYPRIPITIRMLLCHRSSINDSQGYKRFDKILSQSNSLIEKCFSNYAPGSQYKYCNLNYNLLGSIIESVTGKRFDKYIRKQIIKPLGLHGSFNVLDLDPTLFVKAYKYDKQHNSFRLSVDTYLPYKDELRHYQLGFSVPFLSAAGGMKITVAELAKYMIMHMNGGVFNKKRIIRCESEELMRQIPDKKQWYALSLSHYNTIISGERLLGQTGGAHGIHTAMIFHPEKKYGFVVFCNGCKSKSTNGQEMNFEIIKILYNEYIINK